MRHGPMVGAHGEWTSLLTKPLLAKTDAPSAAVPMAMGPWVVTYGELTPLFIKAVEPSFGQNRCPMGHSAHNHGPMGGSPIYGHGPMGGSPTYGHGPMGGSPTYGHGPMGGSPTYGHGPMGGS